MDSGAWWATYSSRGCKESDTKMTNLFTTVKDSSFVGCPFSLGLPDVFLWLDWGYLFFDKNFKKWSCVLLNVSHQKVLLERCNIHVFKIITGPKCVDLKAPLVTHCSLSIHLVFGVTIWVNLTIWVSFIQKKSYNTPIIMEGTSLQLEVTYPLKFGFCPPTESER